MRMPRQAVLALLCIAVLLLASSSAMAGFRSNFVDLMNKSYGKVCTITIEGTFTKTIRVDWTPETVLLHTIRVFSEIGSAKESLYEDGVRYFKFPNDVGTYNVIDWKTGEKKLDADRARYFFPAH